MEAFNEGKSSNLFLLPPFLRDITKYSPRYEPFVYILSTAAFLSASVGGVFFARWLVEKMRPPKIDAIDLTGKTTIITGSNSGIGKAVALDFAKRGARVILACRNVYKAVHVATEIEKCLGHGGSVRILPLDLSSMDSVRRFCKKIYLSEKSVDILINNAGITCRRMTTDDGFEIQFATNYLGHFLLTNLLLDKLVESAPSRIVNVTSNYHRDGIIEWDDIHLEKPENYRPLKAYSQSKLANILFTKFLAKKLSGTEVTSYAVHPGFVNTDFAQYLILDETWFIRVIFYVIRFIFAKSPRQGARTVTYCALESSLADKSGLYYEGCKEVLPSEAAQSEEDAERLWNISTEMVQLEESLKHMKTKI